MTDENLPELPPKKTTWSADISAHKGAYIANGVGLPSLVVGSFMTAMPPMGWLWPGPVLLSTAGILITAGFVKYQKADSDRTDEKLRQLQAQVTEALKSNTRATAELEAAATNLDAARDAVSTAAEALRASVTPADSEHPQAPPLGNRLRAFLKRWLPN